MGKLVLVLLEGEQIEVVIIDDDVFSFFSNLLEQMGEVLRLNKMNFLQALLHALLELLWKLECSVDLHQLELVSQLLH